MAFLICLIVGGIAGVVAAQMMKDAGYGMIADVAIGVIGGLIGGWLFVAIGISGGEMIASIIAGVIGAAALLAGFQAAKRAGLFAA